jgi:16S rRNA (cytosine967-C5)-methyltransferase
MMKVSARKVALEALTKIDQGGAYSNLLLNQILNQYPSIDPRDRNLITELVYGTIQHQRLLDFHLQPFLKQNIGKLENWVKQLLRLSIYQFLFLDRIPERAVVHESVELSKTLGHKGITGMVNGVLRNFQRTPRADTNNLTDPIERIAVETSHPTWMVRRWAKQFGLENTQRLCLENNRPPRISLRVNRVKVTREELISLLENEGFQVEETKHSKDGIVILSGGHAAQSPLFKQGYFTIQDESSMLITPLLDPKPGMKVLDACAAPGGKTTHIAEHMRNEGEIIANDIHPHKEKLIIEQAKRLGLTVIKTTINDARKLGERFTAEFDRILLDAPCSGFGVIRRKPDVKWKKKEQDVHQISEVQYELLQTIAPLLKKEGQLVYSTCTLDLEENQNLITRFIQEHPQFSIVEGSTLQIFPYDFGSDGFFMTKLVRNQ